MNGASEQRKRPRFNRGYDVMLLLGWSEKKTSNDISSQSA